jgi:hypothetical protein
MNNGNEPEPLAESPRQDQRPDEDKGSSPQRFPQDAPMKSYDDPEPKEPLPTQPAENPPGKPNSPQPPEEVQPTE